MVNQPASLHVISHSMSLLYPDPCTADETNGAARTIDQGEQGNAAWCRAVCMYMYVLILEPSAI